MSNPLRLSTLTSMSLVPASVLQQSTRENTSRATKVETAEPFTPQQLAKIQSFFQGIPQLNTMADPDHFTDSLQNPKVLQILLGYLLDTKVSKKTRRLAERITRNTN